MGKGLVKVFCGEGQGKSTSSLGCALICAAAGKEAFVVQFLKGKLYDDSDFFERLEPEIKMFRFEKEDKYYTDLSADEQKEESMNILNGINFARKVLSIGECDLLVLDEVLGLVDLGIITVNDIVKLIEAKDEEVELIMTGRQMPKELVPYVDYISKIDILKKSEIEN